jgi:predicted membrane-bound dolichyl-phosphate-mannose-protein mannosyltransferase
LGSPNPPLEPPVDEGAGSTAPRTAPSLGERLRRSRPATLLGDVAATIGENLHDPERVLLVVLVAAFLLRIVWLNLPGRSLIFDEAYYVNAARVILGSPATSHYVGSPVGLDPNTEHPPLGKLLIAGSMLLFGDNGIGWRIPSVIAAIVALIAIYAIVRQLHRSAWLAILVVVLVSFDNLTFVHGRIGTLDILVLAPMLVAAWLAVRRRWVLAGIAMGIALLIKLTAIYGVGAVLLYVLLTEGPGWWQARRVPLRSLVGPALFVVATMAVALGGLTALDARFTSFATPFDHIARMVSYGANLRAPISAGYCPGADSRPWDWLFNECQIQYLREDLTVRAGGKLLSSVAKVDFRGAFNPLLVAAIPLAGLFALWYAWRTRSRLALWAIAWAAANYLPYVALAIFTPRIEYIYYALPLVPAIAIAIALLLMRAGLPRFVRWGFLGAYLIGFLAYFPFRQIP